MLFLQNRMPSRQAQRWRFRWDVHHEVNSDGLNVNRQAETENGPSGHLQQVSTVPGSRADEFKAVEMPGSKTAACRQWRGCRRRHPTRALRSAWCHEHEVPSGPSPATQNMCGTTGGRKDTREAHLVRDGNCMVATLRAPKLSGPVSHRRGNSRRHRRGLVASIQPL